LCGVVDFNGAAFFQSGKFQLQPGFVYLHGVLQWSRFFSKRKIAMQPDPAEGANHPSMEPLFFKAENAASVGCDQVPVDSFNGAAFFQSGKSVSGRIARLDSTRFNGAAFFQSGK